MDYKKLESELKNMINLLEKVPEKYKEPHTHRSSRSQWDLQVLAIIENLDSLDKELRLYQGLQNNTMSRIIKTNMHTRLSQLKQKLQEKPPKDRPIDIANNNWCSRCLSTYT